MSVSRRVSAPLCGHIRKLHKNYFTDYNFFKKASIHVNKTNGILSNIKMFEVKLRNANKFKLCIIL